MAIVQRNWKKVIAVIAILVIFLVLYAVRNVRTQTDISEFPQPEVINSENGVLDTSLEVKLAFNTVQDPVTAEIREIETPTYEGTLTGPTLRVKPGDHMLIDVINNLPPNPPDQRMGDFDGFPPFPHDPFTTNLHTHGLSVSPQGNADNPFREMEPGTTNQVDIQIPPDHQTGTFWYHPHKHGSVSFQFFGGMSGFLIIEGGEGTLDDVPEVKAARDVLMAFQAIRTDQLGKVPFVNLNSSRFSSEGTNGVGVWSTYQNSFFYLTTNGVTNPVLHMRPGEVVRLRLLNASSGLTLVVALQDHELNIISNDGITVPEMVTLEKNQPYVMGSGNRVDVLIKAGEPGTYSLQALNPRPCDPCGPDEGYSVITQSGIDPAPRLAKIGFDFPVVEGELEVQGTKFPFALATIVVSGNEMNMSLPDGPLPVPESLPSIEGMLNAEIDAVRNIAFEICGTTAGMTIPPDNPGPPTQIPRLPSCGWYFDEDQYGSAEFWGGIALVSLLMMRDADDEGEPNPDPATSVEMPLINFKKEGLFHPCKPLFRDDQPIFAGNIEEWTIINRSFSDHPHHIHTNPFLVTHINGKPLPQPEYRDTIIVPAALPSVPALNFMPDITTATPGSITYRTEFEPTLTGSTLMHCHILSHEDLGMMQRIDICGSDQICDPQEFFQCPF